MPILTDPARIRAVLEADRAWAIYVRQDNFPAQRVYEALGFERACAFYEALARRP